MKRCRVTVGSGKASTCNAGDARHVGSTPGLGRSLGEGNGNPLQFSCLENPHGQRSLVGYRGAWWATVHGVTKSWTQLSTAQHDVWKCIRGFPLGLVEEASLNSIFCFTSPQELRWNLHWRVLQARFKWEEGMERIEFLSRYFR